MFTHSAGEGSSNAEGASGSSQAAAGNEGGNADRDANALEPFLAMDDGNRRLHGKNRKFGGSQV